MARRRGKSSRRGIGGNGPARKSSQPVLNAITPFAEAPIGGDDRMSFESRNPATGEVVARYPEHTAEEVEACLARAWSGWKKWSATPLAARAAFLHRLADTLEGRVDEFARLITLEMGKPLTEAQAEVKKAASGARHFVETGPLYIEPQAIPGTQSRIFYQPLGPVLG